MSVQAQLFRENSTGGLVAWEIADDSTSPTGFADPVADYALRARLGSTTDVSSTGDGSVIAILKRLRAQLSGGGTIALTTATLDALETISLSTGTIDSLTSAHGSTSSTPTFVQQTMDRQTVSGLSFAVTLGVFGTHQTSWVDVSTFTWLEVAASLQTADAVTATIEFTNATDPNVTPPASTDVVRPITTTLGGAALGGIDVPSFGIPAQMQWARITVTDLTGGQDIVVDTEGVVVPPAIAQVPIITDLTDDFRAGIVKAVLSGKTPTGNYENVRVSATKALQVRAEDVIATQEGSQFQEGIIDTISVVFSRDSGAAAVTGLVDASSGGGGTATHDATEGQVVFATPAAAGSVAYFESSKTLAYEPGHQLRAEQTIEVDTTNLIGDAAVEWGAGEGDGSGGILNGIYWRLDASGLSVRRMKGGVVITDIAQASFNRDLLDGVEPSLFRSGGSSVAIDTTKNNYYLVNFEWLGAAPPEWAVQSPSREIVTAHIEEYPNSATGTTVPEPNLPLFVRISNDTSSGGIIEARSGSWRGGVYTNRIVQTGQQPDGDFTNIRADGVAFTTSTQLIADATFTSDWIDTDGWSSIEIFIATDQPSAVEGVNIDFTDDTSVAVPTVQGTRTFTLNQDNVDAGLATFRFPAELDGFRVRYTNGGTGQNSFLLVATLRTDQVNPQGSLAQPLDNTNIGVMTRGPIALPNDAEEWDNVTRADGGGMRVAINEYETEVPIRPLDAWRAGQLNVGFSAPVQVAAVPLADRKTIVFKNNGANEADVFVGASTAVSANTGFPVSQFESVELELSTAAQLWAIASGAGGSTNTQTLSVDAVDTTGGALNSTRAFASDDSRMALDNQADFTKFTVTDYTPTLNDIAAVRIGFEGRKESGQFETVTRVEGTTNITTVGTAISTGSTLTANSNSFYVAFVSYRETGGSISSVTGLGLTWVQVTTATSAGNVRMEVWRGTGTPTSSGAVTANFTGSTAAAIVASRWAGVDLTSPVQAPNNNTGATAAWSVSVSTSTANGRVVGAVAASAQLTNNPGGDDTEHTDFNQGGSAAQRLMQASQSRAAPGGASLTDGTLSAANAWAACALALRPATAINPIVTLKYEVSGTTGATILTSTLSSTADASFTADVTGDRAWTEADVDAMKVTITAATLSAADAQVDHIFVRIDEASTGAVQRCAFLEIA